MVTVSSIWGFVVRVMPAGRRRGMRSLGSSPGGAKLLKVGRGAALNGASSEGLLTGPPHPDPELLGSAGSVRPLVCSGVASFWTVSSTALFDQALVVERMLPYPL